MISLIPQEAAAAHDNQEDKQHDNQSKAVPRGVGISSTHLSMTSLKMVW